jgi:hypothetical protein
MHNLLSLFFAGFVVFLIIVGVRLDSARSMAGVRNLFGFFILAFAGFWLYLFSRDFKLEFRAADPAAWAAVLLYVLFVIGVGGVVASALSALGPLRLPTSYEWPAGYVRRVVTSTDGKYIVPLWPLGRIQVYDSKWHFICGWNVDAWGGPFIVQSSPDGVVEVFTLRGDRHYTFTEEGHLISSGRFSLSSLPPQTGQSAVVPTPLLLWIFSSPILSGAVALISFAGLDAMKVGH